MKDHKMYRAWITIRGNGRDESNIETVNPVLYCFLNQKSHNVSGDITLMHCNSSILHYAPQHITLCPCNSSTFHCAPPNQKFVSSLNRQLQNKRVPLPEKETWKKVKKQRKPGIPIKEITKEITYCSRRVGIIFKIQVISRRSLGYIFRPPWAPFLTQRPCSMSRTTSTGTSQCPSQVLLSFTMKNMAHKKCKKVNPLTNHPLRGYTMVWVYISIDPSSCGDSRMHGPSGTRFSSGNLKSGCEYLIPC